MGATFLMDATPLTGTSGSARRGPSAQVTVPLLSGPTPVTAGCRPASPSLNILALPLLDSMCLSPEPSGLHYGWNPQQWGAVGWPGTSTELFVSGHRTVKSSFQYGVYCGMKDAFVEMRKPG